MYIVRLKTGDKERGVALIHVDDVREASLQAIAYLLETDKVLGVPVDTLFVPDELTDEEKFQRIDEWYVTTHQKGGDDGS